MPVSSSLVRTGAALAAAGVLAACGTGGTPSGAAEDAAGASSPAPTPAPPHELCRELVVYRAGEALDGDSDADHRQQGLSDGQKTILIEVVAEAKAERKRHGEAAARRLIEREAKRRCAALGKDGGPASTSGDLPA